MNYNVNQLSKPGASTLQTRKIPFDFSNTHPIWNRAKPEWSHMINGGSLTLPYLEPFLIRTTKEALSLVKDAELVEAVRGFVAQEGQHYQVHRKYNEMVKANGYAELANIEDKLEADYARLQKKSLQWRLAYTAGFETITIGLTEWLIRDRHYLFGDADSAVSSFILWHMVEESEHKNVAFDLYQHLVGSYFGRLRGLLYALWHIAIFSRKGYMVLLQRDGQWTSIATRLKVYGMIGRFTWNVFPAVLRSMLPRYHPSQVRDIEWVAQWGQAYANLRPDQTPLLDTQDPEMPAQF